jgi:hypothetical protein
MSRRRAEGSRAQWNTPVLPEGNKAEANFIMKHMDGLLEWCQSDHFILATELSILSLQHLHTCNELMGWVWNH